MSSAPPASIGLDQGRGIHHAQYNEHAMLREVVTSEDVLNRR